MGRTLFAVLLSGLLLAVAPALAAGQSSPATGDAFRDTQVADLVRRAREARRRDIQGLSSYEGLLRERIYVGLTAVRFRRERGLFEQERLARIRWSADGERAIQWLGARRAIPIVGADTRRDRPEAKTDSEGAAYEIQQELRSELPEELLGEAELPAFVLDPMGDRLAFGGDWALHPLADSAEAHYRFASGDTLRLTLPMEDREVVLLEVRVEPRRADFNLVAGSLWFDSASASLVRASYKPARAFDLLLDEPEDAEDVPGFLRPVEAEISYVTVEYSLHEFRFWLPRRFAMEGEARMGRFVRIPLTVEWNVRDYTVNEAESEIPFVGPLPPGWSRREQRIEDEDGRVSYVTVVVPEAEALLDSPELSADFGERAPGAFSNAEIDELRSELEALLPTYSRFRPRLAWGFERGLVRFNRVEGLSAGSAVTLPLGPRTHFDLEGRIGTGDWEPNVTAALQHGVDTPWRLTGYHRLTPMSDWNDPFSFGSTLGGLFLGIDRGQFYRATGVSLGMQRGGNRVRWNVEGFYERQREVGLGTDFFVLSSFRDTNTTPVLQADRVTVGGGRLTLNWFSGIDPNGLILTGQVLAEVAEGDAGYQRFATSLSASHPLPGGLAGAVELGVGGLRGDDILQRHFFLGGTRTLRGADDSSLHGVEFWRARAELGSGFAGARITMFSDMGWAGSDRDLAWESRVASLGVGASLLDGLFRIDVARAYQGVTRWKLYIYLDGLL